MKRFYMAAVLWFLLMAAFNYLGASDEKAAEAEQAHYCDMVAAHLWPDYKGIYWAVCRKAQSAKESIV